MNAVVAKIAIMLVPALFSIMMHEVSHGYVAERFGDPTARLLGRLNLNPFRHLDPIGTLAIFIFGFGWAKPVPVNPTNFRRPRHDMIWVALAGPVSNFILALIAALLLRSLALLDPVAAAYPLVGTLMNPLELMLAFSLYINILLGVFNLIPLPPLDGGRVLVGVLPERQAKLVSRLEPFGFLLVVVLVFFTGIWPLVLAPIINGLVTVLSGPQLVLVEQAMRYLFGL
jgi:Zn-dependent protease